MLSFASLRPQIMTRTPSSRNRRAVSYPMPLPPPVTMARRFLMPRSMELSFDRVDRLRSSGRVGKVARAGYMSLAPAGEFAHSTAPRMVMHCQSGPAVTSDECEETHVGIFGR